MKRRKWAPVDLLVDLASERRLQINTELLHQIMVGHRLDKLLTASNNMRRQLVVADTTLNRVLDILNRAVTVLRRQARRVTRCDATSGLKESGRGFVGSDCAQP